MKKLIMLCLLSFFFLYGAAFGAFNFIDNGDGTVTDARTGLIWLKNANPCGPKNWYDAVAYCRSLKSGDAGLTDGSVAGQWRLSSVKDLQGIMTDPPITWEIGTTCPAPCTMPSAPFINVEGGVATWWASTFYTNNEAYRVRFSDCFVGACIKSECSFYVWPVRDPVTITTTTPATTTTPSTTTTVAINNGLIAYYPFNGNANDESGHGHNGTVYGAIYSAGTYLFDGLNDYIGAIFG